MAIRTKNHKIGIRIILFVSIDIMDLHRNMASVRIGFGPATLFALSATLIEDTGPDVCEAFKRFPWLSQIDSVPSAFCGPLPHFGFLFLCPFSGRPWVVRRINLSA